MYVSTTPHLAYKLQGSIGPNKLVQYPPYKARQVLRIILIRAHDHSHPNGGQQGTPVLSSPKNEPFAARRNPRTLEALRQHVHRKVSAPMLCLDKYSNT